MIERMYISLDIKPFDEGRDVKAQNFKKNINFKRQIQSVHFRSLSMWISITVRDKKSVKLANLCSCRLQ